MRIGKIYFFPLIHGKCEAKSRESDKSPKVHMSDGNNTINHKTGTMRSVLNIIYGPTVIANQPDTT